MRNKFAGKCYICGKTVKVGEGFFQRVKGKGWLVKHATGTTKEQLECTGIKGTPPTQINNKQDE